MMSNRIPVTMTTDCTGSVSSGPGVGDHQREGEGDTADSVILSEECESKVTGWRLGQDGDHTDEALGQPGSHLLPHLL